MEAQKKETLEELVARIEASNEHFVTLSPAKQRVVIAQDCLDRMNIGHLTPSRGKFIDSWDLSLIVVGDSDANLDGVTEVPSCSLKDRFNEIPVCSACAKGSLLLAFVGRINHFDVNDLNFGNNNDTTDKSHAKLLEIFDIRQLALIEMAFEDHLFITETPEGKPLKFARSTHKKASDFFHSYEDSNERMRAICETIIENKGTFKL
jgi:hypothetical protein